jgi:hypothetical protein
LPFFFLGSKAAAMSAWDRLTYSFLGSKAADMSAWDRLT